MLVQLVFSFIILFPNICLAALLQVGGSVQFQAINARSPISQKKRSNPEDVSTHARALTSIKPLLFNDSFDTLNNWIPKVLGPTTSVRIVAFNATSNTTVKAGNRGLNSTHDQLLQNALLTNVTHCPIGCYKAEVQLAANIQSNIFSNTSDDEYWLGFSFLVPAFDTDASFPDQSTASSSIYHFRLIGNTGTLVKLYQTDEVMKISFCGNSVTNPNIVCRDFSLGPVAFGQWMDFVIHSQLAYGGSGKTGSAQVWRNGQLLVSEGDLITAYNEVFTPYIVMGTYQVNWKNRQAVNYHSTSTYISGIKIGSPAANYAVVYTGTGLPCGNYCAVSSSQSTWWTQYFLWGMVPVFLIIFFAIVMYFAAPSEDVKEMEENETSCAAEVDDVLAEIESTTSENLSYEHMVDTKKKQQVKKKKFKGHFAYEDQWKGFKSQFRNSSLTRTIFWYGFAMFFVLLCLFISFLAYGLPSNLRNHNPFFKGLIPLVFYHEWSIIQLATAVISFTMICIYFIPMFYLQHDFAAGRQWKNDPDYLRRIGVIIPCHKSAQEVGEVLRRVLKYFPPENVVVCDNGNFDWPSDNTFEVVKAIHPKIRYLFIQQGHKTRALWTGVHRLPAHVEYVMHLDDDTHLDEHHMVFDESHFHEKHVIAVAFLRSSYGTNTVTEFTDFWYKITDHFHATQAKIATRCFVPGPCGLWKRDKFMEIFGKHPSLPFGEDIFGGFTTLNNGYAIRSETRCMVKTFAPDVLTPWFSSGRVQGYGASSLWKQRAHRWTVSALRITGKSLYSFLTYDTKRGICSNLAFRLYRFREYKLIIAQLLYVPICAAIMIRGYYLEFVTIKFFLFLLPFLRNVYINYICWCNQPELQV